MSNLSNEFLDLSYASDSGAGDGSTVDFVTSSKIKGTSTTSVYVNGIKKFLTTHYTINLSNHTITFVTAPALGQKINITYAIGV
jgi:hypothetical protein